MDKETAGYYYSEGGGEWLCPVCGVTVTDKTPVNS